MKNDIVAVVELELIDANDLIDAASSGFGQSTARSGTLRISWS